MTATDDLAPWIATLEELRRMPLPREEVEGDDVWGGSGPGFHVRTLGRSDGFGRSAEGDRAAEVAGRRWEETFRRFVGVLERHWGAEADGALDAMALLYDHLDGTPLPPALDWLAEHEEVGEIYLWRWPDRLVGVNLFQEDDTQPLVVVAFTSEPEP
ncbi:hypothetical protein [Streptomyces sp. NPDC005438]|uniref:hypothetical protein n=1 Tax=Streptomyces sp. NPDC005438 TaxID=3156880 RepID=UPI0033B6AE68